MPFSRHTAPILAAVHRLLHSLFSTPAVCSRMHISAHSSPDPGQAKSTTGDSKRRGACPVGQQQESLFPVTAKHDAGRCTLAVLGHVDEGLRTAALKAALNVTAHGQTHRCTVSASEQDTASSNPAPTQLVSGSSQPLPSSCTGTMTLQAQIRQHLSQIKFRRSRIATHG